MMNTNINENKPVLLTAEEGLDAIMAILEGAPEIEAVAIPPKNEIQEPKIQPKEMTYDGHGHVIAVNGKSTTVGASKKRAKRVKSLVDLAKEDLMDTAEVVINRSAAFKGKVGRNSQEGIVVRMSDADYTVKVMGHAKREFEEREEGFVPEKSYATRGTAENHSSAIAKLLVAEIENENSIFKNENQNSLTLLEAKASAIRLEIVGSDRQAAEFSFKITKKRARIVIE